MTSLALSDDDAPRLPTMADFERLQEALLAALQGPPADHQSIPFERFRAEVLALYRPPLRGRSTCQRMGHVLSIVAELGVKTTDELTTALVVRFVQSRPAEESPNTTYSLVSYLRAACNWGAAEGYLRANPFSQRKHWVRRVTPRARRVHSREEIARVLNLMERDVRRKQGWAQWRARRLHVLTALVAYTGMRRNEALYLRVADVLLEERMILVRSHRERKTKTEAAAQPVPIPPALVEIIKEWLPHLAVPEGVAGPKGVHRPESNPTGTPDPSLFIPNSTRTGSWVGGSPGHKPLDRLKTLGKRAGVPDFTFQSLRHSWATHAEYWGLSDAQIQRMFRHTNTRTQWHYRHAEGTNLRAMADKISFGNEPGTGDPVAPPATGAERDQVEARASQLDDVEVAELKRLRGGGWSYKALQELFNASRATVLDALKEGGTS